jgi:hypothetical protein
MPALSLDIIIIPTYNTYTLAVVDNSTYPTTPPAPDTPWIQIDIPGFNCYSGPFIPAETNIFNSTDLGITTTGNELPIPDGIYGIKYTVNPAYTYYVEKSIMRVDQLQERYDEAFMQLDMMECDRAIKTQSKVDLLSIYFLIQGSIAAANNCANVTSAKLYAQASNMLDIMIESNCGCTGTNYIINFQ